MLRAAYGASGEMKKPVFKKSAQITLLNKSLDLWEIMGSFSHKTKIKQ